MPSGHEKFPGKALLVATINGLIVGVVSRLFLMGTTSNDKILPSLVGLAAILVIAYGVAGILFGLQYKVWGLIISHAFILAGGIMWVVPFPS